MTNKIGEFITGPKFTALAQEAVDGAIAEANVKGLPKAYSEYRPAPVITPMPAASDKAVNLDTFKQL